MNLFNLKCDGRAAVLGGHRIPLPGGFRPPQEIVLGIRPEHVELANPEERHPHAVQGKVVLVENLGMSDLVSVRVRGAESLTLRALIPSDRP